MRTARELDRVAVALDNQMIVIQDTASRVEYLQFLDRPHLPRLDLTEKQARDERERLLNQRADMQQQLDRDQLAYQKQFTAYDGRVKIFEHDCAGSFRRNDLETAQAQLGASQ